MNLLEVLDRLDDNKRHTFLTIRANMRKAYLCSIQASVGMQYYSTEDDTFLDALDQKVGMLMARAGVAERTDNVDPFAHITRPASLIAMEREISEELQKRLEERKTNDWSK